MTRLLLTLLTVIMVPFYLHADGEPKKGVDVVTVTDTLHVLVSPMGGNVLVSSGDDGVFLVDDQLTGREDVIADAVKKISDQPIEFILNTHFHFDHTGGNVVFGGKDSVIMAHDKVRERLSTDQFITYFKKEMPAMDAAGLPVVTFNDDIALHYNGDTVEITHVPNAHTDGDAIARFVDANVIAAGDIIFNDMYPFIDTEHGGSITGMVAALDVVLGMADDKTAIVPGHGSVMSKTELRTYRNALATIQQNITAAITEGKTLEDVLAMKPTKDFDPTLGGGFVGPDAFTTIVYNNLK